MTSPPSRRPVRRSAGLREVAERAGVSVKTVSNVVNDYPYVSDATRERVQAALDELQYQPNLSARHLRSGRTGVIALAVPELNFPYFAALADVVVEMADRRGWTVVIEQTGGNAAREQAVLEGLRRLRVDGILLNPMSLGIEGILERRDRTPIVLLGERMGDAPLPHVSVDNVNAAREATLHLADMGARRIACIGSEGRRPGTGSLRLEGYLQGLAEAGLEHDPTLVAPTRGYHRADGAAAMAKLLALDVRPDAVFAFNDLLALGAMRQCLDQGLRLPDDLLFVGFDDIEECEFSAPRLSSVRPDLESLVSQTLDLLAQILAGEEVDSLETVVGHELVVRTSSAADKGTGGVNHAGEVPGTDGVEGTGQRVRGGRQRAARS